MKRQQYKLILEIEVANTSELSNVGVEAFMDLYNCSKSYIELGEDYVEALILNVVMFSMLNALCNQSCKFFTILCTNYLRM